LAAALEMKECIEKILQETETAQEWSRSVLFFLGEKRFIIFSIVFSIYIDIFFTKKNMYRYFFIDSKSLNVE
jgi:hypothetical protein